MNSTQFQTIFDRSSGIIPGKGRSASVQCGIQVAALAITLVISSAGGLFTGKLNKSVFKGKLS